MHEKCELLITDSMNNGSLPIFPGVPIFPSFFSVKIRYPYIEEEYFLIIGSPYFHIVVNNF